jgi:hypothetical protein
VAERLGGELKAHVCDGAVLDRLSDPLVVARVNDDGDVGPVLRRRTDHCGPSDVNALDRLVEVVLSRDRLFERIEVDAQDVHADDSSFLHLLDVVGVAPVAEEAAVHKRVQGLHAPVEHLGETGDVADVADGDARFAQRLRRASCADDLEPL